MRRQEVIIFSLLVLMLFSQPVFSQKKVLLPDLLNPAKVVVGDKDLFIIQDTTIFVYGLKDYRLKAKFGQKGEGPGEFPVGRHFNINLINLTPLPGKIAISSRNKVMVFSDKGKFLQEKKIISGFGSQIIPLGDYFVAQTFSGFRGGEPARSINLYNAELKKIRELYKQSVDFAGMGMGMNSSRKINEFSTTFGLAVGNNKIYLFNSEKFLIQIINLDSSKDSPIEVNYSHIKITSRIKEKIWDYYKTVRYRRNWEQFKSRIEIPSYFPALQMIQAADGKLYVQTFKNLKGESEFYIYNSDHTLDKVLMLPLAQSNAREYFPFYIKNGKLYQIVEDEDQEAWILQIHDI